MYDNGFQFCEPPCSNKDNTLGKEDNETADNQDTADEFNDDKTSQLEARAMEEDDEMEIVSATYITVCDKCSSFFLNSYFIGGEARLG